MELSVSISLVCSVINTDLISFDSVSTSYAKNIDQKRNIFTDLSCEKLRVFIV